MILAGDVGGTKSVLGLFRTAGRRLELIEKASFRSADYRDLVAMIEQFVGSAGKIACACFGVAGPVVDGRCRTTNLPWVVDAEDVSRAISGMPVLLVNDLVATAHGVDLLRRDELMVLQAGVPTPGNRALIAAGTGLGEALLFWDGHRHLPCPSEGGHSDFAPRDEWEIGLLRYLLERHRHVSYERLLCGSGISILYDYMTACGERPSPDVARKLRTAGDRAPIIAAAGVANRCPVCRMVVERFVSMYGAEAGNLALKVLAVNGVFIGGGIAPKLKDAISDGRFVGAFCDKGRFGELLADVPIYLVLNQETALLGAARFAAEHGGRTVSGVESLVR